VDATFKGADFSGKFQVDDHVTLNSRISLLRAKNNTTGDFLVQMPADKYDVGMEYKFADIKLVRAPRISVNAQYVNRQWRVPADGDYVPPPRAYFLVGVNAAALFKVGKQELEFGIAVTNLLNESYRDYMNRFRYYTDDLGRNISFRLKIPFGYEKK
jgi:iron complex outermembrane receptor protein